MTFGDQGKDGARVHDLKTVEKILDIFRSHGHTEVCQPRYLLDRALTPYQIDTARTYAGGSSEEYLGKINEFIKEKGFKIETKLAPRTVRKLYICFKET